MSELFDRKEVLKKLIKRLHEGADFEEIKQEFQELMKDVTPTEIAQMEEELVNEGMPREEVQRLCDVHIAVFRESLEKGKVLAPAGHPVHILMEEHKMLLKFAGELKNTAMKIKSARDFDSAGENVTQLNHIAEHFKESESHYLREENILFPYLEKHGITQPPAIMWSEHNEIRGIKKKVYRLVDAFGDMDFKDFAEQLEEVATALADMLSSHFYKENNILFPASLKVIEEGEWKEIRRQFDELGYCCFTPPSAMAIVVSERTETPSMIYESDAKEKVSFKTGNLSKEEVEAIFNTLPLDITFVDKEDTVRYFSESRERIFPRTKAIIGRKVQQCHPQKSIHVVNQILEDFKSGRRDAAEFWIELGGRLIHIRYFAVRNKSGNYLGSLEVTQDITDIKKIEGEKRLL